MTDFKQQFADLIDGNLSEIAAVNFLLQINEQGYSEEVFAAAVDALKQRMKKIKAPAGAIDICGTGGDKLGTLNVSTACCFVLAACGVKVAKHGNKAISSQSGSADIFKQLGVRVNDNEKEIVKSLEDHNLSFLFAPFFHASLKNIANIRLKIAQEYNQVTIFNYLGPLLNPANTKKQLIGVSKKEIMQPMAQFLATDPQMSAYIIHGFDNMDEITICDKSYLLEVKGGQVQPEQIIDPQDYGFQLADLQQIKGGDVTYNAEKLVALLSGEKSAYRDIVVLNCAFALKLAAKVDTIEQGINLANDIIDQGQAKKILEQLRS